MSDCIRSGPVQGFRMVALTAITVGLAATAPAALPGETGQIAFSRGGDIWVANPDGTEEAQFTSGPENDRWPRWSPEGNRIAVVRDGDLVLLDATGALLRALTNHGDVAAAPSWSPDGRSLVYVRGSGGIAVVLATLAASNGTPLDLGLIRSVAWNPLSSEQIAYTDGGAVFTVRPDGSEAGTEIVPLDFEGRTRDELAWSPQANQVVFTSTAADGTTRVEGAGIAIDGDSGSDRSPAWSPDGQRLLFTRAGTLHAFDPLAEGARVVSLGLVGATPDGQPSLISAAAAYETDAGTQLFFRVRPVGGTAILVGYQTASGAGTATADVDYSSAAGEVSTPDPSFGNDASISISISGDAEPEQDETFFVDFTFPSDPAAPLRVRGTILNDDGGRNGMITYTGDQGVSALDPVRGTAQLLVPAAGSAVFSPRGDRLAYLVGADASQLQLVVADASGVPQVAFPVPGGIDHEITWSPDGARLAWTAGATLWVADPSPTATASAVATDALTPSWSADPGPGPRRLAFARVSSGAICTIHEDGTGESCSTTGYQPRWSPDNTAIAFLRGTVAVFLMSPDGTNERLVASATGSLGAPLLRWSPRGGYFALMTGTALDIRHEGGPQTTPPGLPPSLSDFDWSPDGNRLVVQGISPAASEPSLWVVGPDEAGTPFAYARPVGDRSANTGYVEPRWSNAPFRPTANLGSLGGIEFFQQARADVRLSAPSPDPITLTWDTVDTGTATPGFDYVPVSGGTVVLQPGEMNAAILVTLLDDALQEGPEFFEVRLVDASGALIGPDRQVPVFITDDEVSNGAPVTVDDVVATALDTPVDIEVLANDTDPDGDLLTLTAVGAPAHGTVTFAGGIVTYTPETSFDGFHHFLYTISDGNNHTANGLVSVYVDMPLPPPPVLTVTPTFLDFGQVPLNKTKDLVLTVTNNTAAPVALSEAFPVEQADPQPFDTSAVDGCRSAGARILNPGQSCTQTVRFWSVPGAAAASPATVRLLHGETFDTLATVALFASTGPPDTGPNAPPSAVDDLAGVAPGFTHTLDALRNDSDPDNDLLRIVSVTDPPHGTVAVISCGGLFGLNRNSECIQYVPDAGYVGPDAFAYTVTDGRGGTASATYHLAVGNVVPVVTAVTPSRGPISGGQAVRITGANFIYRSDVAFVCGGGVVLPLTVTQLGDTEILATTPPAFPGACALRVRTPFGHVGQLADAYRYGNAPPTAADDGPFALLQGIALTVPAPGVLANDADADADPLTARLVTAPGHGTVTLLETGGFEYTASATYSGPDSFTYVANDGQEDSGLATVSLVVHPLTVAIDVAETIHVTDAVLVEPSVMINVTETITVTDTVTLASPLVTVTPASGVQGGTTTLTATLTSLGAPVPGQQIDFSLLGNPVLGGATTGTDGVATVAGVSLAGITPGAYPGAVQASFAGDATLGAASGSGDLTVSGHPTSVTLTSSVNPSVGGQAVTFTATVQSAAGLPQGSVELTYRLPGVPIPSALGTISLEAGTGSLTTSDLKVGDLVVTARYLGNENFEPSSAFLLQTVTPAPTTTTLAASSANAFTTRPPVFTATVATAAPWPATGSVEFFADGVSIGRAPVFERGGVHIAVMGGATLGVGTHMITAHYGGDAFHLESETGPVAQTVIQGDYVTFDLTPTSADPSEATAINASDRIVGYSFSASTQTGPRSAGFLYTSGLAPLPGLGGSRTIPVAINDAGQVVGWSATAGNVDHAFLYQGGQTTDLGTLGGATSHALAINNAGQIVGTSDTGSGTHAFLYEAGTLADLGTLGGSESAAFAINASGFAAGVADLADGASHAAFYTRPWLDLGTLGGTTSRAVAINDAGQVAGTSDLPGDLETHAFLWQSGDLTDLAGPAGPASTAFALNDAGQVVGWTVDPLPVGSHDVPPSPRNAFLYSGEFTTLGTLSGGTSQAFDISNSGLLVGVSDGRAFVSSGGLLRDLGTLGGSGSAARAINDRGVIIGAADTAAGLRHAVAWLPVPVPTLSVPTATGQVGATTTLSATLTLFGSPLGNQTIAFTLAGAAVGSATTDATGAATLSGVPLAGLAEGMHPGVVQASYDGFGLVVGATRAAGDLTVTPAPVVLEPQLGGLVPAPRITISDALGDQTDPHVSGDLLSYTFNDGAAFSVHSYRFSTGADAVIPVGPPGTSDSLADVAGDRIAFSRTFLDGSTGVLLFDANTSQLTEIDPEPGRTRFGAALGGDTIAFADFNGGDGDIYTWDLALSTRDTVSAVPANEWNPGLSPDGRVLVWERCPSANCDVHKAQRTGGAWVVAPVTTTLAVEGSPDTDGTWIVYDSYGRPENPGGWGLYLRPVADGPEIRLALPGARQPSISRGVISFERPAGPSGNVNDVFVYVLATNTLYQVTDTPTVQEGLSDVSVLPNGDIRVVWAAADDVDGTSSNIYAVTFTPSAAPVPPTAIASGSAAICDGASTQMAGSGGVACSWSPATGLDDASSCTPSASPNGTTTYTLTVTSAGGLSSTNAPTVTVTVNPRPTAVASGTATITAGQSTPLSGSGGDSCLWSPAAGLDDPASCTPNAAPAFTTTYALTVTTAAGCVSPSATVTVTVVPPRRTLSVTKIGLGSGNVTSAPAAIDCGATCAASFDGGTFVSLTATPAPNFVFGGWTGDPDCADGSVTMDADKACTAAFNRRPNLRVTALSAPLRVVAGATIAVTDTTRNTSGNGGPAFPGGTTRLYFSTDNLFDPADTVLGERALPPLPPGASDSATTSVTIPASAAGTYWIIARADADNVILETVEGDNTRARPLLIGPPRPPGNGARSRAFTVR